jgi:hypothetical protein
LVDEVLSEVRMVDRKEGEEADTCSSAEVTQTKNISLTLVSSGEANISTPW